MGYLSGVLLLIGIALLVAKKPKQALVVLLFAGLFGWGTFLVKS